MPEKELEKKMDLKMLPVYIIIILVLIVLPIVLGRKAGISPMEILLGKQAENLFFRKRKKKEEPDPENVDPKGTSGKPGDRKKEAVQKNSSRQELMTAISAVLTYSRRNRFYCIVPGTLVHEDKVASLAAIVVTKGRVLGFNCFGYGGTLYAGSGDDDWRQILNGEEKKIESPVVRNRKQKEILDAVLKECGYLNVPTEIYGVFTASGIILKDHKNTRCHTQKAMMEILKGDRFMEDKGLEPAKIGKALEAHVKRKD